MNRITRSSSIFASSALALSILAGVPAFAAADTTPPSVPSGLSGSAYSPTQINLSWAASTDDVGVRGYQVFRGGTLLGSTSTLAYYDTGLAPSTSYTYTVDAYDSSGNISAQSGSFTISTPATDTSAPSTPTGLTAASASASQINLSWSASSDNVGVTGYRIYRNGTQVGTASGTSYSDTGLSSATAYSYTVAAYDAAGNASPQSSSVSATTGGSSDTTAPSIPTSLTASAVSSSQINISWAASSDNVAVTQYVIYRGGTQVGVVSGTSFSDTGLSASTAYTYTVAARDAAGNTSAQSASASATTYSSSSSSGDTSAPTIPTNLSASAASASQINLSWTASSDNVGVTGYRIYRNGSQIGTVAGTSYADSGLSASTAYSYTVAAYDAAGNTSAQSSSISATTLASGSTTTHSNYSVPPTVDIGPDGSVLIHGLTVTSVGTNTFTGTVWGITYTVNYSGSVAGRNFRFLLRNGNGSTVDANQIQVGDTIGMQGSITASQPTVIQAQIVRNYSIATARPLGDHHKRSWQWFR